jgi:hypothetical protein
MSLIIGIDEAGYGPNFGPLVVTASVWRTTAPAADVNLWGALSEVVTQERPRSRETIQVADSKDVYTPQRGLSELERSIRHILEAGGAPTDSFQSLAEWLQGADSTHQALRTEPWFADTDVKLPVVDEKVSADDRAAFAQRLAGAFTRAGLELVSIRSDIVLTERFNELTTRYDSKGLALSRITLGLLRSVWDPDSNEPTLVIGDKHGGRNRYDDLLSEQLDGQVIQRLQEGSLRSCYRVGRTELHFQQRAEAHFPVAVSSMVCKYLRELSMELFNQFWQSQVPGLKPTKGYPQDAKRFRKEIVQAQHRLGISDSTLWRAR